MDWLKKKKEEAKKAAAKLQNQSKSKPFKGDGQRLGGESQPEPPKDQTAQKKSSFQMPAFQSKPPALSEEEQQRRREQQAKALEARGNAWEKRVDNARRARLAKEKNSFERMDEYTSDSSDSNYQYSNEEVKNRELETAQQQMGFNPYAATFSSSSEAVSAVNNKSSGEEYAPSTMPPPAPVSTSASTDENGAVYILLCQEMTQAVTASETIDKILNNIIQNPDEDKFRRIRLQNAAIQKKLVHVKGAVELLMEAGFVKGEEGGEEILLMSREQLDVDRVKAAIERVEVALVQLRHDAEN